ncbi:stage II sporulation protein D [Fictibacillus aquaticus]|uniref:Stage II sporulation protein D n=1 Tax=Fictibacillus aquaticus TaxID=2021314 RepID=A0A235F9S1_9BACL|nr:stage II sporulation protein D [Fictibacillus aquaticus]OYD57465.1 stage II sporulation protein D [Fictibacillus aquaticus]
MNARFKPALWIAAVFIIVVLIIPSLLVLPFSSGPPLVEKTDEKSARNTKPKVLQIAHSDMVVPVYRNASEKVENIPLEEYVAGVVASEMPANFEVEALKAQALTARTYIVNRLMNKGSSDAVPAGAIVTDTVQHQVYASDGELKQHWGKDYKKNMEKIIKAVNETSGKILTYDGKPINASFFSTSNGYTENSEEYWDNPYPYLKSVKSPWDEKSPKFKETTEMSVRQVERLLGVKLSSDGEIGKVKKKTTGNKIAQYQIGKKTFSGREIREKLKLRSSDFSLKRKGKVVLVSTKGYGHGVGMSQYGANGMAAEGKSYQEIVKHYYKNVVVTDYRPVTAVK